MRSQLLLRLSETTTIKAASVRHQPHGNYVCIMDPVSEPETLSEKYALFASVAVPVPQLAGLVGPSE
jgi:hypothetical protein